MSYQVKENKYEGFVFLVFEFLIPAVQAVTQIKHCRHLICTFLSTLFLQSYFLNQYCSFTSNTVALKHRQHVASTFKVQAIIHHVFAAMVHLEQTASF